MPALTDMVSEDAYLALDAAADERLELLHGVVVAMAGASPRHTHIVGNVFAALHAGLAGRPCLPFAQDQRVRIEQTKSYAYPDVVVVCGEPVFDTEQRPPTLENPTVIVEVLSDSTLEHDSGPSWRSIDSSHPSMSLCSSTATSGR